MQITLISNSGDGDTQTITLDEGTTLATFCGNYGFSDSDRFSVRVNKRVVPTSEVLQDGDRITVTPTKVPGALVA